MTDWELKGVPVRVAIGPRDLDEGTAMVARRDRDERVTLDIGAVAAEMPAMLEEIQSELLERATELRDELTVDVTSVEEAAEAARTGFARVPWSLLDADALERLGHDAITVRCLQDPDGDIPDADDAPGAIAVVGRSY